MDINKKALTLSYKEKADVTIFICNKKIILCSWLVTSIILLNSLTLMVGASWMLIEGV